MKLYTILFMGLAAMAVTSCSAQQGGVLVVHSYHAGYPWVDEIDAGIREGLAGSGAKIDVFYMDTKRRTDELWKIRSGKMAYARMVQTRPRVAIAVDDNAQRYFVMGAAHRRDAPQFVFCGVNAEPAQYEYPRPNVTGILERPHFIMSIDLLLKVAPGTKRVAFLSDKSPTSDAMVGYCQSRRVPVEMVAWDQPVSWAEWQRTVKGYAEEADAVVVNMYHTVQKEAGGESMDPEEVMAWTIAHLKMPTVALFEFGVEDGALCGIVESGREHGMEAAAIARDILARNKMANDFPIRTARKGSVLFNARTARALGVEIPPDLLKMADKVFE